MSILVPASNDAVREHLRGLARNPALPIAALLRLAADDRVDRWDLTARREWTDDAFDALAAHPDPELREALARSSGATAEQRARLVGDLSIRVLHALIEGPPAPWTGPLPDWVHRRLAEHPEPVVRDMLTSVPGVSREIIARLTRDSHPRVASAARELLERKPPPPATIGRDRAVSYAAGGSPWNRAQAAADPELPAEWVTILATDPSPHVRLAVSMRPELTEQQRALIDYPADPVLPPLDWVLAAGPEELHRCARSAHPGLRRSAACHPGLPAALIAELAADDDPAVRSLLCENHADVPGDLVLRAYLAASGEDAGDLLRHPAFPRAGLAGLAGDPDERARALVVLDPATPAALIERLSHDESATVRAATAADARLPVARVLALLQDHDIGGTAAANPNLPLEVMSRIMASS